MIPANKKKVSSRLVFEQEMVDLPSLQQPSAEEIWADFTFSLSKTEHISRGPDKGGSLKRDSFKYSQIVGLILQFSRREVFDAT